MPIRIPSPNIRIDNGLFHYNESQIILEKIDFQLDMTSRIALLGPNGIGKTTLINIMTEKIKLAQGDFFRDQKVKIAHFS